MSRAGEVRQLLAQLDQAYDRRSWHGTNLRGSLRRVSADQAAWRPAAGRHNIWEIAVHAAYWKYVVWRRLTGAARGSFELAGSNWFERPHESGEHAWRHDLALLERTHRSLRDAVGALTPRHLSRRLPAHGTAASGESGSGITAFELVSGIIAHDLYHAGQIQLLKKLQA